MKTTMVLGFAALLFAASAALVPTAAAEPLPTLQDDPCVDTNNKFGLDVYGCFGSPCGHYKVGPARVTVSPCYWE